MAITINTAARNAACDAVVDLVDAGAGAGILRIYDGTQPAGPGTAVTTQTLLAEFTLSEPAFTSASSGSATLDVTPALTDTGIADGTATWFRIVDGNGTNAGVIDGSAGATSSGEDLELNSTTITTGVDVEITGGTITMPAGTP